MVKRFFRHLSTINRHRYLVLVHCAKAGIIKQGLCHDLSKYSPAEVFPSVRHFQGFRSPIEKEREQIGYSQVWLHHQGRNRHHFEYWRDYDLKTRKVVPVEMPLRYVVEMICDRMAASKVYYGKAYTDRTPLDYFKSGNHIPTMHPKTAALLEELLTYLADHGEKETFRHLRSLLK